MNHQQWLEWRRGGVGSSDAPIIMGKSISDKTLYELWEEKTLGVTYSRDNPSMKRGRDLEPVARNEFEKMMDIVVFPKNVMKSSNNIFRASLDGIDFDGKVVVEIKCPGKEDHSIAEKGKIPEKYIAQCQHQLHVTGLPGMYYFSFDGQKGKIVEVARDDKFIDEMILKQLDFWNCVVNHTPPPLTDKDFRDMAEQEEWPELTARWREVSGNLKKMEMEEKAIRSEMIEIAKMKNAKGCGVKLSKSSCQGNIDYKSAIEDYIGNLRKLHPDITFPDFSGDAYRKESYIKWRISSY